MNELPPTLKEFWKQEMLLLAFVDQHGQPRVAPVRFVIIAREYYIGTGSDSTKWKGIQSEPRVGWVIDGGSSGKYNGVPLYGKAEEITDKRLRASIYRALGEKYFGSPDHPEQIELWGEVDDTRSVYLRLNTE
jgi:nitroimidazol reductase NimA-like FMN-containing flavoprotein (pyridoxamine 5'-phosphate oxidase superfamily)